MMMQFVHHGCDDGRPLERQKSTVTGGMLASLYNRDVCDYPPEPPRVFISRATVSTLILLVSTSEISHVNLFLSCFHVYR